MVGQIPWIDDQTIGLVLRQTARRFGQHEAIVFSQSDTRYTWAAFDEEVDKIARGLLALGFQPGDHFGVWSTNWPEWVILQFATARIGIVLVTINPAYRADELAYALAQSDVRGLALIEQFKKSHFYELLDEVCPELRGSQPGQLQSKKFPKLKCVIGLRGAAHPGLLDWHVLAAAGQTVAPSEVTLI